jgi:hypothetical protein
MNLFSSAEGPQLSDNIGRLSYDRHLSPTSVTLPNVSVITSTHYFGFLSSTVKYSVRSGRATCARLRALTSAPKLRITKFCPAGRSSGSEAFSFPQKKLFML